MAFPDFGGRCAAGAVGALAPRTTAALVLDFCSSLASLRPLLRRCSDILLLNAALDLGSIFARARPQSLD